MAMPAHLLVPGSTNTSVTQFVITTLSRFSHSLLVDSVLLHRNSFVEKPNVFYASLDGTVGGIPNFLHCAASSECLHSSVQWSVVMSDEHFVSSPIDIAVAASDQAFLLLVSNRGSVFVFDLNGNLISQVRIPNVIMRLRESETAGASLSRLDPDTLASRVRWDWNDVNISDSNELHRLTPKVFTSPLVLTGSCASSKLNSGFGCVLIPVNFISSNLILASLLSIGRQALVSDHLRDMTLEWLQNTVLIPLELDRLNKINPPYMFSKPVPISFIPTWPDLRAPDTSAYPHPPFYWQPIFSVLVTLYNGRIYRVRLPLKTAASDPRMLWQPETRSTVGFSQSCFMVDCPQTAISRVWRPRLCCLLLDDSACLRLIVVDFESDAHITTTERVLWIYQPHVNSSIQQQLGHVVLAPGSCADRICDLWAVYATSDGFTHAVSINAGKNIPGYPLHLNSTISFNGTDRSVASGPGLLYTPDGHTPWMLFADTFGWLYHLRLTDQPVVITSHQPLHSSNFVADSWISPMPITLNPHRVPANLGLIVTNTSGIALFVPGNSTEHKLLELPLFDATFLDERHQPSKAIHLGADHHSIAYRIHNCPLLNDPDSGPRTTYAARLVDSNGQPLSAWSVPEVVRLHIAPWEAAIAGHSTCEGTLVFTQPVYGSFRMKVYLLVVNLRTGRFLTSPSSRPDLACSVLLDAHTAWPQLLLLWTYMPLVYFFSTVIFFHWQQSMDDEQPSSNNNRFV